MDLGHMASKVAILYGIGLVQKQENYVETRQQSCREVYVLVGFLALVISSIGRVRSCQNRGSSVESRGDSSFSDGNGLLLHNLVDVRSITLVHLVELIDCTDSCIGENKSSTL